MRFAVPLILASAAFAAMVPRHDTSPATNAISTVDSTGVVACVDHVTIKVVTIVDGLIKIVVKDVGAAVDATVAVVDHTLFRVLCLASIVTKLLASTVFVTICKTGKLVACLTEDLLYTALISIGCVEELAHAIAKAVVKVIVEIKVGTDPAVCAQLIAQAIVLVLGQYNITGTDADSLCATIVAAICAKLEVAIKL